MISIVDDDTFVREAIGNLLRSLGYRAVTFASPEDFLGSGRVKDTTCLITEGYRTPIIFVSALPKESIRTRALNAGAVAFLSKPFDEASLMTSVELALNETWNRFQ